MTHALIEFGPAKTYCGLDGGRCVIVPTVAQVTCLNCLRVIHAHAGNSIEREQAKRVAGGQRRLFRKRKKKRNDSEPKLL